MHIVAMFILYFIFSMIFLTRGMVKVGIQIMYWLLIMHLLIASCFTTITVYALRFLH